MNNAITIHLVPNAHIDPVWLWDWREGLNEGIATCRAVLDLMDEFPALTFVRGEAAIYLHIRKYDPPTFRRIARRVKEGRWDVVGGTLIQPDTNLPATETFIRQFLRGVRYFKSTFNLRVRTAWAADSFGHSAGLPDVFAAAGIENYAFTRPSHSQLRLPGPAFWWQGEGGGRILAYRPPIGAYLAERGDMIRRLDRALQYAQTCTLRNIGVFIGLGNHGGGPSRRHILDAQRWSEAHPGVNVVFSTLHRLFAAIRRETSGRNPTVLPVHTGELNYCFRGCYASAASLKFAFRRAESALVRAETTDTALSAFMKTAPADLLAAWDGVLFNAFHDILPGTSIERACDEQAAWLGHVIHESIAAEGNALNRLAARVDTTVKPAKGDFPTAVALLIWNPHPHAFEGHVEMEACLDTRPISAYTNRPHELPVDVRDANGRAVPFQEVPSEQAALDRLAWRKRVAVPVKLPPLGWSVFTMQYVEKDKALPAAPSQPTARSIRNECLEVKADPRGKSIAVRLADGRPLTRIAAITVDDPWGSWGAPREPEGSDLSVVKRTWRISKVEVLEQGAQKAVLGVKMSGGRSALDLRLTLWHGTPTLHVSARVLWNEKDARLKLVLANAGDKAEYEIPGGTIVRAPAGEVPGGRWAAAAHFGFASDALYAFDLKGKALRTTICRASRYCYDPSAEPRKKRWLPILDRGELKFRCLLTTDLQNLPRLAAELERPPVVLAVPPSPGSLPRRGTLMALHPDSLDMLALKPPAAGRGIVLRARARRECRGTLTWLGKKIDLGRLGKAEIATWQVTRNGKAVRLNAVEERASVVPAKGAEE